MRDVAAQCVAAGGAMRILSREPVHLEIPEGRYIVYITTLLVQLAFTVLLFGGTWGTGEISIQQGALDEYTYIDMGTSEISYLSRVPDGTGKFDVSRDVDVMFWGYIVSILGTIACGTQIIRLSMGFDKTRFTLVALWCAFLSSFGYLLTLAAWADLPLAAFLDPTTGPALDATDTLQRRLQATVTLANHNGLTHIVWVYLVFALISLWHFKEFWSLHTGAEDGGRGGFAAVDGGSDASHGLGAKPTDGGGGAAAADASLDDL